MRKITRRVEVLLGEKENGESKVTPVSKDNIEKLSAEGFAIKYREVLMGMSVEDFICKAEVIPE